MPRVIFTCYGGDGVGGWGHTNVLSKHTPEILPLLYSIKAFWVQREWAKW